MNGDYFLQTLSIGSVEQFIDEQEQVLLQSRVDGLLAQGRRISYDARARGRSIHEVEGLSLAETVAAYLPASRVELDDLPEDVTRVLDSAFVRSLDQIRVSLPCAAAISNWLYVEYSAGQFISPHIDLPTNDHYGGWKVAAISVSLNGDFDGGEFSVETCGSFDLWQAGSSGPELRPGADSHSEWFRRLRRTRWLTKPAPGTALLWGSRLTHGTLPVTRGIARKFLGFVTANAQPDER